MNRLLAGGALCLCTAFLPHTALAADATLDYRQPGIVLPQLTAPQPRTMWWLRPALYALQAIDAVQTAAALRKPYRSETNPMLRPFTHGGIPTIALGFALGDITRDRMFRRASHRERQSIDALQAISNVDGIIMTARSMRAP